MRNTELNIVTDEIGPGKGRLDSGGRKHDLYKWMSTDDKKGNRQTDWCFWMGEYNWSQDMNRAVIKSQRPPPRELARAQTKWPAVMRHPGSGFRPTLTQNYHDAWVKLTVTNQNGRSDEGSTDNTNWDNEEYNYADTFNLEENRKP